MPIDLDSLLKSISTESPSGPDVRNENGVTPLDQAREFRTEEDPRIVADAKSADWPAVVRMCESALRDTTKDLELAGFLAEGLARTEGFAGLLQGLQLLLRLQSEFWDTIHPGVLDGAAVGEFDPALRAKPLGWIGSSNEFFDAVRAIPMTAPEPGGEPLTVGQFERIDDVSMAPPERRAELVELGFVDRERWRAAFLSTPVETRDANRELVQRCLDVLQELDAATRTRFEGTGVEPSFIGLRDLLEAVAEAKAEGGAEDAAPIEFAEPATAATEPTGGAAPSAPGALASRQDAIHRLREVAAYLRSTQPHSPVSYLIDRAVRWLEMPFEELMDDFIKNHDTVSSIRDLLGMPERE